MGEIAMKKTVMTAAMLLALAGCSQQPQEQKQVALDSAKAKLGYAMGMDVGASFTRMADNIDVDAFVEGFRASIAKGETRMTAEEAVDVKQAYLREQQARFAAEAEANKRSGEAFLAANSQKEGITTTASGLQYEVLKAADGARPTAADTVKAHYRGTLIDGTEFDNSYKRGEPVVFPLDRVIHGWIEGLQLMSVGSKYRFYIPSGLAYGIRGKGPKIGPNAVLIFEVELLEIVKPALPEQQDNSKGE